MNKLREICARNLADALMLAGAGALSYGAWRIYEPAGWLVAGALLLVGGVILARG